jgi:hypothetical protein
MENMKTVLQFSFDIFARCLWNMKLHKSVPIKWTLVQLINFYIKQIEADESVWRFSIKKITCLKIINRVVHRNIFYCKVSLPPISHTFFNFWGSLIIIFCLCYKLQNCRLTTRYDAIYILNRNAHAQNKKLCFSFLSFFSLMPQQIKTLTRRALWTLSRIKISLK